MLKTISFILLFLLLASNGMAEVKPYTLIAPQNEESIYLINQAGEIVHSWDLVGITSTSAYLLPDGHLIRTVKVTTDDSFGGGGSGGRVERLDWNGDLVWAYEIANERYRAHHDIAVLPNGHVLILSWERLTDEEVLAAGRPLDSIPAEGLWTETVFEVKPTGPSDGEVVWQWNLADHLVQDMDESKDDFGVIADHPERVNVNYNKNDMVRADWVHANAIDYNNELDQIVISAHAFNELWVIDHSTTTEEAAGNAGGNSGMGGGLIYRWGNPITYDHGDVSDQRLFNQHDVEWIPGLYPGAGRFLVFNNGVARPESEYSTIDEIIPTVNSADRYLLDPSGRYGPASTSPVYQATVPEDFLATFLSGAQRLRNGNTLITNGPLGQVFEVTPEGETIWEYDSIVITGVLQRIFRADRYNLSDLPPTGMVLDGGISGNWYDPQRRGEGYVIEALDDGRVLLIWLTYPPQASATKQQVWMIGVGYLEGDHIVVNRMAILEGTVFGSGFNKNDLQMEEWGRVEIVFDDCDAGKISYSGPPGFDEGLLPISRLTRHHGLNCPREDPQSEVEADSIETSLASEAANGSFSQPERSGEGWFMEYLGGGRVLVQWLTYNLSGNQAWLTGVGRVDGVRVIVDRMAYVTGTEFGANFDPDEVDIQDWGTLEFEFDDCDNGRIRYSSQLPGWGAGEFEVGRLTNIDGLSCDWPINDD